MKNEPIKPRNPKAARGVQIKMQPNKDLDINITDEYFTDDNANAPEDKIPTAILFNSRSKRIDKPNKKKDRSHVTPRSKFYRGLKNRSSQQVKTQPKTPNIAPPTSKSNRFYQSQIKLLSAELNLYNQKNIELNKELQHVKEEMFNAISQNNQDFNFQYMPAFIYINTNDYEKINATYALAKEIIEIIDFDICAELKAIKGSWFKRLILKSKSVLTGKQVTDKLKQVEYGLLLQIKKEQSIVDKNISEAALNLSVALPNITKALETYPDTIICFGTILIVKNELEIGKPTIHIRQLTIVELHFLEKNPDLWRKPSEILSALESINAK